MSLLILGTIGNVSLVRLGGVEGLEITSYPAKAQGTQGSYKRDLKDCKLEY